MITWWQITELSELDLSHMTHGIVRFPRLTTQTQSLCVGFHYYCLSLIFISKNWMISAKKKKKKNTLHGRILGSSLKSGGNRALKMGRTQGKFHSQSCPLEVVEVGTWGVCHFWCCLLILGYAARTTSVMTLDPAAAWETSYCWKGPFLINHAFLHY